MATKSNNGGVTFEVKIDDAELRAGFAKLQKTMMNTTPVMQAIGTGLVGNVQKRLGSGALQSKWAPLNPNYARTKRNRNILVESGGLRGSISEKAYKDHVLVGTNKIYAAIHQFGGVIRPKKQNRLFFKMGAGFFRPKSVTIPARPFLTLENEDEQMIGDVIFRFLQMR